MTRTESPRRISVICCAAAAGLVTAGLLAVHVPPPPAPARPHPAGAAAPAAAGTPARPPSGPTRTGVRAPLPDGADTAGAPAEALTVPADLTDLTAPAGGPR
ncbi:hypothetical protein ACFXPX_24480 [Kitasatospora sp. NPDC059146]|uniref:hypothetical protein n=1 Tax=unclassified Kitasatospora TaxID=2633591 RepID=UPI00367B7ADF